jgi:hypothetical protein
MFGDEPKRFEFNNTGWPGQQPQRWYDDAEIC